MTTLYFSRRDADAQRSLRVSGVGAFAEPVSFFHAKAKESGQAFGPGCGLSASLCEPNLNLEKDDGEAGKAARGERRYWWGERRWVCAELFGAGAAGRNWVRGHLGRAGGGGGAEVGEMTGLFWHCSDGRLHASGRRAIARTGWRGRRRC